MGWEYEITLDFGSRLTAGQRFLELVEAISASSAFGSMVELIVYSYDSYLKKSGLEQAVLERYGDRIHSLDPQIYADFASRFVGGDFRITSTWLVRRYYRSDGPHPEEDNAAVEIHVFDQGFHIGSAQSKRHPTGIIYNAYDYKRYLVDRIDPEGRAKNIEILLSELSVFIGADVQSMWGQDADQSADKRRWSLIYHRNVKDFVTDLEEMFDDIQPGRDLTMSNIVDVIQACENIRLATPQEGIFVYSKLGTNGNLRMFYHKLREMISS